MGIRDEIKEHIAEWIPNEKKVEWKEFIVKPCLKYEVLELL